MNHDHIEGILICLVVLVVIAAAYALYDSWVEWSDTQRVLKWFEDNNLGDG